MVNHGVSRACKTCKKRRKKCDEERPSCARCVNSSRVCLGYEDEDSYVFRHYDGQRKPDLPRPGSQEPTSISTRVMPTVLQHALVSTTTDAQVEQIALEIFFDDYCIESTDRSLSRGFLDGLKLLITYAGPFSDIAQAARIVALAGIGLRTGRSHLLRRTKKIYGSLLSSFQSTLCGSVHISTVETLMTAVLLGLFEIVAHSEECPSNHNAHVRGVAAILSSEKSPFDLYAGTQLFQLGNSIQLRAPFEQVEKTGVLFAPFLNGVVKSLDSILVKLNPMFYRAEALLSSPTASNAEILSVIPDVASLVCELRQWAASQEKEWKPKELGRIDDKWSLAPFCASGHIDTYYDLYVAAVWNTYRKTHLLMLDTLWKCKKRLQIDDETESHLQEAQRLGDGIAASIPFHLIRNPKALLVEVQGSERALAPGRAVGGLLMLHPLWLMSISSIISDEMRSRMRECLAWIGQNMGIGQAITLSKVKNHFQFQYIAEGHVLIWAGMLTQPT